MRKINLLSDAKNYVNLKRLSNNMVADGTSENMLEIYCMDSDYYPARGIDILVKVSGDAVIKQSNQAIYHGFTDINGILRVGIVDNTAEEVLVTVEIFNEPDTRQEAYFNFIGSNGALKIVEIINENQSFSRAGEPSVAWSGATFLIKTSGGSGEVNWKVLQSSAEITVDSTPDGNGRVTIRNRPRQICEIEGTDVITNEKVKYYFHILTFVAADYQRRNVHSAHGLYGNNLLRIDECNSLFSQWGNLSRYVGWRTERFYWTNDIGTVFATGYDFSNASTKWIWNLENNYTVYKIGSN